MHEGVKCLVVLTLVLGNGEDILLEHVWLHVTEKDREDAQRRHEAQPDTEEGLHRLSS